MSTILVTGGTGNLGALVVGMLREQGHEVRALSRSSAEFPVDLRDGSGLDAALAGAQVVVHCASSPRGGDDVAARHLIDAARRAGTVTNLVYISIVGVDVVPLGYYRTKLRVERMLEDSGLGVTILRTTQFHDLVAQVTGAAARLPLPVVPLPKRWCRCPGAYGCSRSRSRRSRTGSRSWRCRRRRGGCRTWAGRRRARSRSGPGSGSRRRAADDGCSGCRWRAARTPRAGAGGSWRRPGGRWGGSPSASTWSGAGGAGGRGARKGVPPGRGRGRGPPRGAASAASGNRPVSTGGMSRPADHKDRTRSG